MPSGLAFSLRICFNRYFQVKLLELKPNRILRGPVFSEPVEVIVTVAMGAAVKLVGRGVQSGEVVDRHPIELKEKPTLYGNKPHP
jgi:hypothetical protein